MGKILVTGAGGFVGQPFCEMLRNSEVDFLPVKRRNGDGCFNACNVNEINASTDWRVALSGVNVVVHLAARVHVMNDKSSDPLAAFRAVNVDATLNLARQAVLSGVKRFVFVSSVKVNGEETTSQPFTVFDAPAPLDPYGQSKLEAEIALRELSHVSGLEVVIVRPPLIYGPGVRANFLKLLQLVKSGVPLPLGAIHNRRSMVALDNIVDFLFTCTKHPAAAGQTFLVSDNNDVSISELLRMLAGAMGKRSMLIPVPAGIISGTSALFGQSAMTSRLLCSLQVDIGHTKSTLGWQPVVGMRESINKTVAHFLAQY